MGRLDKSPFAPEPTLHGYRLMDAHIRALGDLDVGMKPFAGVLVGTVRGDEVSWYMRRTQGFEHGRCLQFNVEQAEWHVLTDVLVLGSVAREQLSQVAESGGQAWRRTSAETSVL